MAVTINGTGSITGLIDPTFSAYATVGTSVGNATWTKLNFGTELWDTNNNFASSRFTPTVAGYYQISASVQLAGNANNGWAIAIYKNATSYKAGSFYPNANLEPIAHVSGLVFLNGSTDYVEIYGYQQSGSTLSTLVTNSAYHWFDGLLVRASS
jgi:hypothetical protein